MKSQLSLEVNPTADCTKIRVQDTSVYNPLITVSCPQLIITVPGFFDPVHIETVIAPNFNIALTAFNLKLQANQSNLGELPDGVYNIHYSINPNEKIFVIYNHLRDCKTRAKYYDKLCALDLEGCVNELEEQEKKKNYEKLKEIDFYLTAAKAYVEECEAVERGMELFKYANKLLAKLNLKCKHC